MKKSSIFINLSTGIEFLPTIPPDQNIHFIRIQSTWCEQKRWNDIIADLDYTFLMYLVLGYKCMVYDCSRRRISRALWQGIPWVKYVLERIWFNRNPKAKVKNWDVTNYFDNQFRTLTERTKNKIKYFRKFLLTNEIDIEICGKVSQYDGKYNELKNLLIRRIENEKFEV